MYEFIIIIIIIIIIMHWIYNNLTLKKDWKLKLYKTSLQLK